MFSTFRVKRNLFHFMFFFLCLVYWLFLFSSRCNFFSLSSLQLHFHLINEQHHYARIFWSKIKFLLYISLIEIRFRISIRLLLWFSRSYFPFTSFRFVLLCFPHFSSSYNLSFVCTNTLSGPKGKPDRVRERAKQIK